MLPSLAVPAARRAVYAIAPALLLVAFNSAYAQTESAGKSQPEAVATVAADSSVEDKSFSSSADALESAKEELTVAPVAAAGQYGGGYERHNRPWMSHLAFEAGGGANAPTNDSSPYITWGGNVTIGAGYRFNSHFSLLAEYQFIDDKLPGRIISETGADGGHAHIWSLTMAPVVYLFPKARNDIYFTGGGGFYRKVTSFTDPQAVEYCDYFSCGIVTENQVVGHFSSNQGGWNVGAGVTHRLSGNTKLFAEVRYLDVKTPAVTSQPNGLGTTSVAEDTTLIPVTFGIRF
jgi:opacity protein-like surface antigen